jgi:CubicO group peptidase (beta-lactamase class C family)
MVQRFRYAGIACVWATAALTGCNPDSVNTALDTYCDASGCVSANQFSANLDKALQNKVVGYISIVGLKVVTWGQARTQADAPSKPMDTGIPTQVASVSKTLTTIGVLQSLAKNNLTVQSPIAPYIPPGWSMGPGISGLKFQQLLTHTSGFREGALNYAQIKQQVADGVMQANQTPKYDNGNFSIFRVLLPFMEKFSDNGEATRQNDTTHFYLTYMQQHVFQPSGVSGADCKPPTSPANRPILVYPFPPGNNHGNDSGDWSDKCGGGGWVLSASDLFKVLQNLYPGNNALLTDTQKAQMSSLCLGWDCSVQSQVDYVGKNGEWVGSGQPSSGYELNTWFSIFKGKLGVIVITNSDPGANINQIVPAAFQNAKVQ